MNTYVVLKKEDFEKVVEFFKKDIATLRTGRANPSLLEGVHADAYGVKTPLNGLANINISDGKSLTVTPWDKGVIKNVEKSIAEADLGVSIVNEGDKLRLNFPQMTEENRKDLVKKLNEKQENARISVRKVRDEVKVSIESAESAKEITEDDKFRYIKELDDEVRAINDGLKGMRDKKEEEIMTI